MIVPEYWAEARVQHKVPGRQVTVRRFGWSDTSQEDAQANAQARAAEALQRILSGKKLERRELKMAYNGADGMPIREEILERHGDVVITRNTYGAHCLNTPNVLFADVDLETRPKTDWACGFTVVLLGGVWVYSYSTGSWQTAVVGTVVVLLLIAVVGRSHERRYQARAGQRREAALDQIKRFSQLHPDWHLRVYETPAGFRVLVMHDIFDPADAQVTTCFAELKTDPVYVQMCQNQRCFRARVSPKPWRIGIAKHIRPRPGVWPVKPERLPQRHQWIEAYERKATGFASCRFLQRLGSGAEHPEARRVQALHDRMARANVAGLTIG